MNQKKVVLFTIIAIISCIVFMIISMFAIWSPKKGSKKESLDGRKKVYSYVDNENFKEKTFNLYKSEVKRLLMPINVKQLYEKLDEDYLNKNNLNIDNISKFLTENNLLSNNIEFKNYIAIESGDTYIYRIMYNTLDDRQRTVSSCVINLIEESPFNYTLSFEGDSLDILKHNVTRTVQGINFNIKNVENTKNSAKFEIIIKNTNEKDIELNFDDVNNVMLVLKNGNQIKMSAAVISSEDDILTKGSSIEKEAFFTVNLEEQGLIKGIKFNKIKIDGKETTVTVEF